MMKTGKKMMGGGGKQKKSDNSKKQPRTSSGLSGSYYATYPVLFAVTEEIVHVEKYMIFKDTTEPDLFVYKHCWRLLTNKDMTNEEWHPEKGAGVVRERNGKMIDFAIAEAEDNKPEEKTRTGEFYGTASEGKNNIEMIGLHSSTLANSMKISPRITSVELGDDACPIA